MNTEDPFAPYFPGGFTSRDEANALALSGRYGDLTEEPNAVFAARRKMTKENKNLFCSCGGSIQSLDVGPVSETILCLGCGHATLVVDHPSIKLNIRLADFHVKRGDGVDQRQLSDLSMASRLVDCLNGDQWPSPATCVDFGIESCQHLGALAHAVRSGIRAYELDRVMGDGLATTILVKGIPGQPYEDVVFGTAYAGMLEDYDQ